MQKAKQKNKVKGKAKGRANGKPVGNAKGWRKCKAKHWVVFPHHACSLNHGLPFVC
jgi:hypothetical protein